MKPSTQRCGNARGKASDRKTVFGFPTHGGDVAQSPHHATTSDGFGRMPFTPEVNAFQAEVGGNQQVRFASNPLHRTVISNADNQRPARPGVPANFGDQPLLGERHVITIPILERAPVAEWGL